MKLIILLLLLLGALGTAAQEKYFTEDELVSVISKFHPVARQAALGVDIARAGVLSARGGFDPRFTRETARKESGGVNYYDHTTNDISIPAWYGIDLYAGTEKITGLRLNPEKTGGSITYLGISVQPLQNLLMDKRRAVLLQARNMHSLSEVQQRILVNDLLREALYTYWDWWEKFHVHQLVKSAFNNAGERLSLVKTAFLLGDRPAIDTIEAYTQVQSFEIKLSEAYQHLVRANLELSAFLWTDQGGHTDLPVDVIPQEYNNKKTLALEDVLNFAGIHPELAAYDYKLKNLQIDKSLAFQSLLPELKLKYNQTGYDLQKTINGPWFNNNYRFGVNFSIPLRLSEGRGEFQKAKLEIEQTRLDQVNKQVQLFTKVKQYYIERQQAEMQLALQDRLLANTLALQRGEEIKFSNGESSLFLLNAREQKTIETQQKLIEIKSKVQKAEIGLRWAAGMGRL